MSTETTLKHTTLTSDLVLEAGITHSSVWVIVPGELQGKIPYEAVSVVGIFAETESGFVTKVSHEFSREGSFVTLHFDRESRG